MRIAQMYARRGPVVSFEFFPPKTDAGYVNLVRTIADLKRLDPSFVSVTWGAGGSTRRKTIDLVTRIEQEIGITAMAHFTCVGSTADELAASLDHMQEVGVENVLALRGDPPRDQSSFRPVPGGFGHADELIAFIKSRWDFCVGGACYPETHPEAPSAEEDLRHCAHKVEVGAEFLITQLFFDNRDFFSFEEKARRAGIRVPIVPGIMPVTSHENIRRMASLCGACIPAPLERRLAAAGDDAERTLEVGIDWATEQCRALLEHGVPGFHFYTLNKSPATRRVYQALFAA